MVVIMVVMIVLGCLYAGNNTSGDVNKDTSNNGGTYVDTGALVLILVVILIVIVLVVVLILMLVLPLVLVLANVSAGKKIWFYLHIYNKDSYVLFIY